MTQHFTASVGILWFPARFSQTTVLQPWDSRQHCMNLRFRIRVYITYSNNFDPSGSADEGVGLAACLLGFRVRILLREWIFFSCECCALCRYIPQRWADPSTTFGLKFNAKFSLRLITHKPPLSRPTGYGQTAPYIPKFRSGWRRDLNFVTRLL